ncbi:hypothetical protein [uncultured Methylobacterium sp.]|uniref:hypothetical protein n=1 Tax=uncultured Methylobacterium sp. TaxID=157278 RepID=UPI0035CB0868
MAFVSLRAWRTRSAERAVLARDLKAAFAAALGLSADDALTVNEIACADPGCADVETVVLVMRAGEPTRAIRLPAPMDAIGDGHHRALVEEERALRRAGAG